MKNNISISDIKKFALIHTASEFEKYCNDNKIEVSWLDVTLTNFNEEYYNVELPYYHLNVMYYDGELEEIIDID
jgi:hypothetical protein